MQIPCNSDGDIFLVRLILCTDSDNHAFETKIRKHFMIYGKELMIILRIIIKEMKILFDKTYFS